MYLTFSASYLHLENGVLAKVDETLQLFLVTTVGDGGVEESFFGLLDLRLFPLEPKRYVTNI